MEPCIIFVQIESKIIVTIENHPVIPKDVIFKEKSQESRSKHENTASYQLDFIASNEKRREVMRCDPKELMASSRVTALSLVVQLLVLQ